MKQQPQVAQLVLKFKGPLVKDSIVEQFSDLLTLDVAYVFEHKMIWVKNDKSYYYLISGDGSASHNWERYSSKVTIRSWSNLDDYVEDDIVHIGTKIYKALADINSGSAPPTTNPDWLCIAGDADVSRLMFELASTIQFKTEIVNPIISIYLCDIIKVGGVPALDVNGMISYENEELISTNIKLRTDIPYDSGYTYEFSFIDGEDNPIQNTGIINIK